MLDANVLIDIADRLGTPCFVYDFDKIKEQVLWLEEAFGKRFKISYAMKSNPNPGILRRMRGLVGLLDISSGGELCRAREAGWAPGQISFTGPAKRGVELEAAIECGLGEVVIESLAEAFRLSALAQRAGVRQQILIRVNPAKLPNGFGVGMAAKPSQFGIDEEDIDPAIEHIRSLPHLALAGFHIYAGTQCLRAPVIAQAYEGFAALFESLCERHTVRPRKLIFGSGLGIPYHEGDEPVDLHAISARINPVLDRLRERSSLQQTSFVLETGRYLVGEAGVYLTRVVSTKRSRGTEIRVCDGGMNHNLAAAGHLGSVIPRNYRVFRVSRNEDVSGPLAPVDLCGPLCTSIDVLARSALLPDLKPGDIVAFQCSGAYGPTASPVHFLTHPLPREVITQQTDGRRIIEDCQPLPTQTPEGG